MDECIEVLVRAAKRQTNTREISLSLFSKVVWKKFVHSAVLNARASISDVVAHTLKRALKNERGLAL